MDDLLGDDQIETAAPVAVVEEAAPVQEEPELTGYAAVSAMDEEPESITKWKAEQAVRLQQLEEETAKKEQAMLEEAKTELDTWGKTYSSQNTERHERNLDDEKAFIAKRDETGPGNQWERVAFLIDFNSKSPNKVKDTSKMKSILIRLKSEGLKGRD
eukprot:m.1637356 g.1637356  ORF g.1637356 m.1637356 type:complete len:158 (-) comp25728_c0_seq1:73-546(-)